MSGKYKTFIDKDIEDLSLTDVPGIGPIRAARLKKYGISNAEDLLVIYIFFNDNSAFKVWYEEVCHPNKRWTGITSEALNFFYRINYQHKK